jgi:hypothetical protein
LGVEKFETFVDFYSKMYRIKFLNQTQDLTRPNTKCLLANKNYVEINWWLLEKRAYFGNTNYFGGPMDISCKSSAALSQAQSSIDTMLVFLADVWLDSEIVMEKLQTLFIGYSDCPPYAFVMMGNFLSEPKYGLRCDELAGKFLLTLAVGDNTFAISLWLLFFK